MRIITDWLENIVLTNWKEYKNQHDAKSTETRKYNIKRSNTLMPYVCGYCGKDYNTIEERMNCEKKCYENKQKEDKNKQLEKLKQERETRFEEVKKAFKEADETYKRAVELENKYKKDYSMSSGNCITGDDFINELNNAITRVFSY